MFDFEQVPLNALPTVMQDAIRDVSLKTKAPTSLIMSAASFKNLLGEARGIRCDEKV